MSDPFDIVWGFIVLGFLASPFILALWWLTKEEKIENPPTSGAAKELADEAGISLLKAFQILNARALKEQHERRVKENEEKKQCVESIADIVYEKYKYGGGDNSGKL